MPRAIRRLRGRAGRCAKRRSCGCCALSPTASTLTGGPRRCICWAPRLADGARNEVAQSSGLGGAAGSAMKSSYAPGRVAKSISMASFSQTATRMVASPMIRITFARLFSWRVGEGCYSTGGAAGGWFGRWRAAAGFHRGYGFARASWRGCGRRGRRSRCRGRGRRPGGAAWP